MISHVWLFATPWTVAHQAPLSMQFPSMQAPLSMQNTEVDCHFLLKGISLNQGLNLSLLCLPYWQVDSLPLSHLESLRIDIGADDSLLYGCPAACRVFSSIPGFFSLDASNTPSSPDCANQGVSRCYQQRACPANYNLSQCHENLAVARLRICQPQVLNPARVRQASLSPPGLPRTDTWAPLSWMEVVLWLSAASKEFSLSRPKSPLNECLTEAPWEMERTCSSVSQLLTATHTWPPHLLEKGWQSNLCAPGAVHGDEEATLLPWPLMVSVMKAEATVSFIEWQAFTNSGRWFSNLRVKKITWRDFPCGPVAMTVLPI